MRARTPDPDADEAIIAQSRQAKPVVRDRKRMRDLIKENARLEAENAELRDFKLRVRVLLREAL